MNKNNKILSLYLDLSLKIKRNDFFKVSLFDNYQFELSCN